jgi:hypothetical protein
VSRPLAADDFAVIRARLAELRRESATAEGRKHVNLKGEEIGQCSRCQEECLSCQGWCAGG